MKRCVAVATSGGRDSTALLHATARAAAILGAEVWAFHVHHGLMPEADCWWMQVQGQCARWARSGWPVRFAGTVLAGRPAKGDSVEAWARRERYRALTALAKTHDVKMILLAHHRRDQAETVWLQAMRGAGAAGLAAMPSLIEREGIQWSRPWLNQTSDAIAAYVRRHRLRHADDTSNRDPRFARSRLRVSVWPTLTRAFPGVEESLVSVARRMQEADACLSELAQIDMQAVTVEDGAALNIVAWKALSAERQANLLREWAHRWSPIGMPESLLRRLLAELPSAKTGHRWPAPGGPLCLRRGGRLIQEPKPGAQDR